MRQKRAKAYRKLMSLYCTSFGFRQPYQVLVDSEMCKFAVTQKYELVKQLNVVLQGTVKPMITQCCIHELYLQGKSQQPAVDLAKTFERRKCNHREAVPGDDCLADVVGETNKHRYVISTQSKELRTKLRSIPAVPVVHITRSVMILEPPSETTTKTKEANEEKSLRASTSESTLAAPTTAPLEPPKKKRKGPKGPNPLSVKKKKAVSNPPKQSRKSEANDGHVVGSKRGREEPTQARPAEEEGRTRKRKRRGMTESSEKEAIATEEE